MATTDSRRCESRSLPLRRASGICVSPTLTATCSPRSGAEIRSLPRRPGSPAPAKVRSARSWSRRPPPTSTSARSATSPGRRRRWLTDRDRSMGSLEVESLRRAGRRRERRRRGRRRGDATRRHRAARLRRNAPRARGAGRHGRLPRLAAGDRGGGARLHRHRAAGGAWRSRAPSRARSRRCSRRARRIGERRLQRRGAGRRRRRDGRARGRVQRDERPAREPDGPAPPPAGRDRVARCAGSARRSPPASIARRCWRS